MAFTVVDRLVTRYELDDSDYKRGAASVVTSTASIGSATSSAAPGMAMLVTAVQAVAAAFIGLNVAIASAAATTFQSFAEYDRLVKALEAVEGSASKAKSAMAQLRDIAKLPGIGLEEAVRGYTGLLNNGIGSGMAMDLIRGAGKANARAGGGVESFDRVMLALSQMAVKGRVSGEEVRQLANANIPVGRILKDQFGTADGDALAKMGVSAEQVFDVLIAKWSELKSVGDSAGNALDNLRDSIKISLAQIGAGVAPQVIGGLNQFGSALSKLQADGTLEAVGRQMGRTTVLFGELLAAITGNAGKSLDAAMEDTATSIMAVAQAVATLNIITTGFVNAINNIGGARVILESLPGVGQMFNAMFTTFEFFKTSATANLIRHRNNVGGMAGAAAGLPSVTDQGVGALAPPASTGYLAQIATNTRKMVELQDAIMGGGNAGRIGLTAHEIAGLGAEGPMRKIMDGIAEMMTLTIAQHRRARLVP